MLLMRRREEAEGERRIMGSGRRETFLGRETREEVGVAVEDVEGAVDGGAPGRLVGRLREKNVSAVLRMWEKSYGGAVRTSNSGGKEGIWWARGRAYGWFYAS